MLSRLTSALGGTEFLWLAAIVILAVALRIGWIIYINVDPNDGRFDDSVFYHNAARLLAQGHGYINPYSGDVSAHRPPAYPLALALVYRVGGWHLALAQALNIAFAAVTVVLVYIVGARVFDRRAGYLGALVLALFPGQVYFSALLYAETLFAMVFMLVLLLTVTWTAQPHGVPWWKVLVIGALIGGSALVRVEGIVLLIVPAAFWALTVRLRRKAARYVALAAIGVTLALTPWTARNAIQLDSFVPLRENAGGTFARHLDPQTEEVGLPGNDPTLIESLRDRMTHPWDLLSSAVDNVQGFYANDADGIKSASIRVAIPPPSRDAIRSVYDGLGLEPPPAWFSDDFEPLLTREQEAPWRRLADRFFFATGAAALVAAGICLARRNQASYVLLLAVLGWTLLFSILYPSVTRYHFPLIPVFSVLAGVFLVFAWDGARLAQRTLSSRAKMA